MSGRGIGFLEGIDADGFVFFPVIFIRDQFSEPAGEPGLPPGLFIKRGSDFRFDWLSGLPGIPPEHPVNFFAGKIRDMKVLLGIKGRSFDIFNTQYAAHPDQRQSVE